MTEPSCTHYDDLPAHALEALDPGAATEMDAHLEHCERCQAQLRWLAPALAALPESVRQLPAPPQLRERLMATVRAESQAEGTAIVRDPGWLERHFRIGPVSLAPATGFAAVLVAVALEIGYVVGDGGSGTDVQTVAVNAQPNGSTATLEIGADAATLQVHGVPSLPPGSVYQVWVRTGAGAIEPSSTFTPNGDGSAAAAVPEVLQGANEVMVTREPSAGRRAPAAPSRPPLYSASVDR